MSTWNTCLCVFVLVIIYLALYLKYFLQTQKLKGHPDFLKH